jgi:hypothetical protein
MNRESFGRVRERGDAPQPWQAASKTLREVRTGLEDVSSPFMERLFSLLRPYWSHEPAGSFERTPVKQPAIQPIANRRYDPTVHGKLSFKHAYHELLEGLPAKTG